MSPLAIIPVIREHTEILCTVERVSPVHHILADIPDMELVEHTDERPYDHLTAADQEEPRSVIDSAGREEQNAADDKEKGCNEIVQDMQPFVAFMDLALMPGGLAGTAGASRAVDRVPRSLLACRVCFVSDRFVQNTLSCQAQLPASAFSSPASLQPEKSVQSLPRHLSQHPKHHR
jgi:hypothetical protein